MGILLIEPAKWPVTIGGEDVHLVEPLALEFLATGIVDHHDVPILDMGIKGALEAALAGLA